MKATAITAAMQQQPWCGNFPCAATTYAAIAAMQRLWLCGYHRCAMRLLHGYCCQQYYAFKEHDKKWDYAMHALRRARQGRAKKSVTRAR
jgi:hypothetical protein